MAELKMELPEEVDIEEARVLLMTKLFETGKLSLGQAESVTPPLSISSFLT